VERPVDDKPAPPPDPARGSDPQPESKPKVTPLDPDKNIEKGIEIDET
jgi:hypothetical protein